jgi:hypothetical protein
MEYINYCNYHPNDPRVIGASKLTTYDDLIVYLTHERTLLYDFCINTFDNSFIHNFNDLCTERTPVQTLILYIHKDWVIDKVCLKNVCEITCLFT